MITWLPIIFFGIIIWPAPADDGAVMPKREAGGGRQGHVRSRRVGRRRRASTRRRRSCRRSSSSSATARSSSGSARACPRASCCYGPPGTGKTLLAKAVAHESGANFYASSASAFVEMFAGLGAARIRKLFDGGAEERARRSSSSTSSTPSGAARRAAAATTASTTRRSTSSSSSSTVSAARDDVVVMGASNRLQDLDPALAAAGPLRPAGARLARRTSRARGDPARAHARRSRSRADVDLNVIARRTAGLTGADLANICNEAAIFAARKDHAVHPRTRSSTARMERVVDRPAEATRRHRQGEAHPRLPRGGARAHVPSHGRRDARAESDDRRARRRARATLLPARPRIATCTRRRSCWT